MNEMRQTLSLLKTYRSQLTSQQLRTLCGQAKSGDTAGALKGLVNIITNNKQREIIKNGGKSHRNAKRATAL